MLTEAEARALKREIYDKCCDTDYDIMFWDKGSPEDMFKIIDKYTQLCTPDQAIKKAYGPVIGEMIDLSTKSYDVFGIKKEEKE